MRVVRAKYAGACYGVQRALNLALAAADDGACACTLGPLIHNPRVVSELEARGIRAVSGVDEAGDGPVIIRSHGVTPQVRRAVEARGLPIIDATCPHVARAQRAAAELAGSCACVVVVGEAGHPEVEGLVAYAREAGGQVLVAAAPQDLPPEVPAPTGVVVQTTQSRAVFDGVVAELRRRGGPLSVRDTVCFATTQRQESAAELARTADAIVVIGGRNSSNTTRLAEICAEACPNTHHIEDVEELSAAWFEGCDLVGVTAGASTPDDQIQAVVSRLEAL